MFTDSLISYGSGPSWRSTLESLSAWTQGRPASGLFRVNPLELARELRLDGNLTVDAFLAGVLEGWFDLSWDFHCPSCQGLPHTHSHLRVAKSNGSCPACQIDFRNQLDTNVEVTFTATPKLASFSPGEQERLIEDFHRALGPGPKEKIKGTLSGLDLLHRPLFHEHFSDEVLSAEESLEIRHVVLLFSDIKGSTRLYEQLGDAKAYNLVRAHFKVLFEAVEAHGGIVVKTIGDAVMASFRQASDALGAALEVHHSIDSLKVPGTDEAVVVKMGVHAGPAIAVTLNDRFDYFGQTVNRAARIQGLAMDQEIYFSETVFQDAACRRSLTARKSVIRKWRTQLKGIEGDQIVYSVQ